MALLLLLDKSPINFIEAVIRNSHSAITKCDTLGGRVVSCLLLALILYGTTVQAVHKHGVVLPNEPQAVSVSNPTPEDSTPSGLTGCADCLVCQLQQSFSAPLVSHRELDPPATQVVGFFDAGCLPASSFVTVGESGRAPPLTS